MDEDRHPKSDITVGRAIEQRLEVATLEDTTRVRYDDLIRIYITPTFGSLAADPPTAAEAAALLSAAWSSDPEWGLLLWLTMVTGLRRGEMNALRLRHVDVDRGVLFVERSNAQPKAGVKEKEPKTRQHRRVALDAQTMQLLAEHRARQEERCSALSCAVQGATFPFSPAPDGSGWTRQASGRPRRWAASCRRSL